MSVPAPFEVVPVAGGKLPSQATLLAVLRYDPETGFLYWRHRAPEFFPDGIFGQEGHARRWNTQHAGKLALHTKSSKGYRHGSLLGQTAIAHRVIWKMLHGTEPEEIDHGNGDRGDNRELNLSASDRKSNARNIAKQSRNTSGCAGVSFCKRRKTWSVRVSKKYIGSFADFDRAVEARRAAAAYMGYSERHGQ